MRRREAVLPLSGATSTGSAGVAALIVLLVAVVAAVIVRTRRVEMRNAAVHALERV